MAILYACIYGRIIKKGLKSPDNRQEYAIIRNENSKQRLVYVALGDSLTAGVGTHDYRESYPYLVAEKLSPKNNIFLKNRSVSGFTSKDLKNKLLPIAIKDAPDMVTLLVGINDIRTNTSKRAFKKNYEHILSSLIKKTKAKIYIINIPFIGSGNLVLPPYNYLFDFRIKELNKIIDDLALKNNLKCIDLYSASLEEFKKSNSYYSSDLFHPSGKGYAFWAGIIFLHLNS